MQGLRRDVGAPQASEQCVIHFMQEVSKKGKSTKSTKTKRSQVHIQAASLFSLDYSKASSSEQKVKCVSCGNPELAASCRSVQNEHLVQDTLQQSLSDVRRSKGARGWEQKEVPRNCRTRGTDRGDVINRV